MNSLPIPYDAISLLLPGGPGKLRCNRLAQSWAICWDNTRLLANFLTPANDLGMLVDQDRTDCPDQIIRELAQSCRVWRDTLMADVPTALDFHTRMLLQCLASELPSREATVEVKRVCGGWVAVGSRDDFSTSVVSYMPRNRDWLLKISGSAGWIASHRKWLERPLFAAPSRLLLLPFAAECLRLLRQRTKLLRKVALSARAFPDQASPAEPNQLDPYELYWTFDIVPDVSTPLFGTQWLYSPSLSGMYDQHVTDGQSPAEIVDNVIAGLKDRLEQELLRRARVPIELPVNELYPILRHRAEAGSDLFCYPLMEELVVMLVQPTREPTGEPWRALDRKSVESSVHPPQALLRFAMANAAREFDLAPREELDCDLTVLHRPEDIGTFLLTPAGVDWINTVYGEQDWVCLRDRGWYVMGKTDLPPEALEVVPTLGRPLRHAPVRWGPLRQAVMDLQEAAHSG